MTSISIHTALLRSLLEGPLLVGDLPEASRFPKEALTLPESPPELRLEQKLGHLYEDALAVLLQGTPRFNLLARNLQIRESAQNTLGELDFVVRDAENGQLTHLELATKFYLAVDGASGLELPGPDARDNYFRKLSKLRNHQLGLAAKYRSRLPLQFQEESMVTQQLIYGCLFDHIDTSEKASPEFLHPAARRGRWLRADEWHRHFSDGTRASLIPKALWPVPFDLLDEIRLDSWTPTQEVDRCVMLRVNDAPTPYFVAPVDYPNSPRSSVTAMPRFRTGALS